MMEKAAPASKAAEANEFPSKFGPDKAKNKQLGVILRLSVQTLGCFKKEAYSSSKDVKFTFWPFCFLGYGSGT